MKNNNNDSKHTAHGPANATGSARNETKSATIQTTTITNEHMENNNNDSKHTAHGHSQHNRQQQQPRKRT